LTDTRVASLDGASWDGEVGGKVEETGKLTHGGLISATNLGLLGQGCCARRRERFTKRFKRLKDSRTQATQGLKRLKRLKDSSDSSDSRTQATQGLKRLKDSSDSSDSHRDTETQRHRDTETHAQPLSQLHALAQAQVHAQGHTPHRFSQTQTHTHSPRLVEI
jgi:hypothetical protein